MGRRIIGILQIGLFLLTLSVVAASAASSRSAVGTWKLDLAKSSYAQMAAPKAEKLVVMVDASAAVKWILTGASSDGKSYVSTYDGAIDGKDHPLGNSTAGNTVAYTRTASGLEWVVKDKSGAIIETGASRLSADGNTLTLKGTTQEPGGKGSYTSVFERVQ
jgi:hypothetical protein